MNRRVVHVPQIGLIVWVSLLVAILLVLFNEPACRGYLSYIHQPHNIKEDSTNTNSMCTSDIKVARDNTSALSLVVFGASGDLASKKIFPTLFALYCKGALPLHTRIVGYLLHINYS